MIITKETDYALRILRVLLDGEKHSVAEMSETELIPNQFAYQILRKLSAGNLVQVSRGALGGCELSCDLDATSLYDGRCDPDGRMDYGYCLDDASFTKLYNKVKKASFDDNKFDLIEVASLGCYYSCAQAVSMMNIFTFGDSKIKALRLMAPHIIDLQNAIIIYQQFNFESEKQKVGEILRSSRISPQNLHIQ